MNALELKGPSTWRSTAEPLKGGVSSSVNDLAHWMSMVLQNDTYRGRPVVKAEALLPAISPQIVSSPPANASARAGSYGYGFVVGSSSSGRVKLGHSGAFMLGAGGTRL